MDSQVTISGAILDVSGEYHHVQAIDLAQFFSLGGSGPRHPRQSPVHAKIILESNSGVG